MIQVNNGLEVYRALSDLARRYQFRNRDEVCCYGLTVSQCYAIEYLAEREAVKSSDLAQQLGLNLSTTTRLIDQLVRKKLVIRRTSEEDARVKNIQATEAGKRIAQRVQQDLSVLLTSALADLPVPVLNYLPEALRKITDALNQCCGPESNCQ
jgi:MarR family transcriptional regulator, 2-MHQ and catechol-resistance regulon repressor